MKSMRIILCAVISTLFLAGATIAAEQELKLKQNTKPSLEETMEWLKNKLDVVRDYDSHMSVFEDNKWIGTDSFAIQYFTNNLCDVEFKKEHHFKKEGSIEKVSYTTYKFNLADIDENSFVFANKNPFIDERMSVVNFKTNNKQKLVSIDNGKYDGSFFYTRSKELSERAIEAFKNAIVICKSNPPSKKKEIF